MSFKQNFFSFYNRKITPAEYQQKTIKYRMKPDETLKLLKVQKQKKPRYHIGAISFCF